MSIQNATNTIGKRLIQDTGPLEYNPSSGQSLTTTPADVSGSSKSITPLSSSSIFLYRFQFYFSNDANSNPYAHFKLLNNGVLVPESEASEIRAASAEGYITYSMPIASWGSSAQILKMQALEWSTLSVKLHETYRYDGAVSNKLRRAILQIQEYE